MDAEVFPHIPDAIYCYEFDEKKAESATNKERWEPNSHLRYFYEYREPEKADNLLAQFMELEASLSEKIAACRRAK